MLPYSLPPSRPLRFLSEPLLDSTDYLGSAPTETLADLSEPVKGLEARFSFRRPPLLQLAQNLVYYAVVVERV